MEESEDEDNNDIDDSENSIDTRGIPEWNKVDRLARYLIGLEDISLTNQEANHIVDLYSDLDTYVKKPVTYKPMLLRPSSGRYGRSKHRTEDSGKTTMKRCFTSGGSPAMSPCKTRLVEAIFITLSAKHISHTVSSPSREYTSSWTLMMKDYRTIRSRVTNNISFDKTSIHLVNINQTTLMCWHKIEPGRKR